MDDFLILYLFFLFLVVIRKTAQREAILKAFTEAGRPLTPVELHELASAHAKSLGLRTVYRHVKDMLDENRILGIQYPGQPVRYEMVDERGSRPHFICRVSNRVFDLPIREPEIPFPDLPGFEFEGYEVIFYGVSTSNAKKSKGPKAKSAPNKELKTRRSSHA